MTHNISVLKERALVLRLIREYFHQQRVMEVDTPLLNSYTVTDPYMTALRVENYRAEEQVIDNADFVEGGYLQTSPEYAMKKLLCSGSGDIYQLNKAFRADEKGVNHRSEFTMLEWYRLGFDDIRLMQEVIYIVQRVTGIQRVRVMSYRDAFLSLLQCDPYALSLDELKTKSCELVGELPENMLFDNYLTLLFATQIEPQFNPDEITMIYDFPASQAALARVEETSYGKVAKRFEAYAGGLELANGFYELQDAEVQLARFQEDNQTRQTLGYPEIPIDMSLIKALQQGLPDCAGVAVGVDRLLMLRLGKTDIAEVLPMYMG